MTLQTRTSPRRRAPRTVVALSALAAIGLAACGDDAKPSPDASPTPAQPGQLDGKTFTADDTIGSVDGITLAPNASIILAFDGDTISLSGGCNSGGGTFRIEDGVLIVDSLATTEMACEQPLMDQDTAVATLLSSRPQILIAGDELTLTAEDAALRLVDRDGGGDSGADASQSGPSIDGTTWVVSATLIGDTVSAGWDGAEATMTITVDADGVGDASVMTGCNQGGATVVIDREAGTLTFGPLATTKMACAKPAMELERIVTTVLAADVALPFEIDGTTLTLLNGDDGLQFTAQ